MLYAVASIYYKYGKIFDSGFNKPFHDMVPDTALDTALLAWNTRPHPALIDLMLKCLVPYGIAGELLPTLYGAIEQGRLTDAQILYTADIAAQYYDLDMANTIISAYKRAL